MFIVSERSCGEYLEAGLVNAAYMMVEPAETAFEVFCNMTIDGATVSSVFCK